MKLSVLSVLVICASVSMAQAKGCVVPSNSQTLTAQLIKEVNAERRVAGLPDLTVNSELAGAAQGHACAMAKTGKFSHGSARALMRRVKKEGYKPCLVAENIYKSTRVNAGQVSDSWMESTGHRHNILLRKAKEAGVGIAFPKGSDWAHWVLVVAKPCG